MVTLKQKKRTLKKLLERKRRIVIVSNYSLDDTLLNKLERLNDEFNHFEGTLNYTEKKELETLLNQY